MKEALLFHANRLTGNRLPGLLRELAEAISDEDDPEKLRRLGSALREIGNIASNKAR